MNAGEIRVDGVSRRFRVHAREARTLKDLFVHRGRTDAHGRLGAPRRLARRRTRGGGRAHRAERLGQDDAAPPHRRDHQADRRARCGRRGASARCSSSAPASTPTSRAARTSILNGSIHGLARRHPRAVRRDRRLRRARARDRPAGAHVLVRDVHAARLRDRRASSRPTSCCSTRCSPSATRRSSASASEDLRVQAARRHDRLRLARRVRGRAALRAGGAPRRRPGRVRRADARGDRPLPARARRRADPAERGAGLREWGTGEATIVSAELVGNEG